MTNKRKLGDKINRGFTITVIILGVAFIIRGTIGVVNHNKCIEYPAYPETMDEFAETANGLDVPLELVDSTVNDAYIDGFFKE